MNSEHERDLHDWVALACIWEASARKAGNVHPSRSFSDLSYSDFVASAVAIAPVFAAAHRQTVGTLVLRSIEATRRVVRTNTNLGIVLLLAPLAVARPTGSLREAVVEVLDRLTVEDSRLVYDAIQLAVPGGMGEVAEQDVRRQPTLPLREVMALAQDRDLIARQYVNGFREALDEGKPALVDGLQSWGNLEQAIVGTHLQLLAHHGDSLIARKCGPAEAEQARQRAQAVLETGWPETPAAQYEFSQFDLWLRENGNRRNPGATADLVTACIFAALRDNKIGLSVRWSWS
jgi:triphosphoribosyl-dephospho-CoA synthase